MSFYCDEASLADIPAITAIFVHDEPPPFVELCLGPVNLLTLNVNRGSEIARGLQNPEEKWLVARDEQHKTAAFAQWHMAIADDHVHTEEAENEESFDAEAVGRRDSIISGMNSDLIAEFRRRVTELRESLLADRDHYLLMNLGTATAWQRKGAATTLVKWPFAAADEKNVPVYLDTTSDGPARSLFEKLGFQEVGGFEIDLAEYGGHGKHAHVGMIRWPTSHG